MALTRSFKETVQARAKRDPAFREALLTEGVAALLSGDLDTGKAVIRDYINATVGFVQLSDAVGTPPKSLMRMFGPGGNPNARNLLSVIGHLQRSSGVSFRIQSTARPVRGRNRAGSSAGAR
jgi:DNA-binding phage protein